MTQARKGRVNPTKHAVNSTWAPGCGDHIATPTETHTPVERRTPASMSPKSRGRGLEAEINNSKCPENPSDPYGQTAVL